MTCPATVGGGTSLEVVSCRSFIVENSMRGIQAARAPQPEPGSVHGILRSCSISLFRKSEMRTCSRRSEIDEAIKCLLEGVPNRARVGACSYTLRLFSLSPAKVFNIKHLAIADGNNCRGGAGVVGEALRP